MLLLSVIDKPTAFIASSNCLKSLVSFIPGSDKEPLFKYYDKKMKSCDSFISQSNILLIYQNQLLKLSTVFYYTKESAFFMTTYIYLRKQEKFTKNQNPI